MLRFAIAALVGLAGLAGASTGASALNRTFVAGSNGNDANACTRAAPCATFTRALTQTDAGGEINVLDGGNFGQAFIDKSVTIQNDGAGTAGVLVPAGSGFLIQGTGIVVTLRGLDIAALGGSQGISFFDGAALHIENCTIRNFTGAGKFGISFTPNLDTLALLFVSDTVIAGNGGSSAGAGVFVRPNAGASVNAFLTRVQLKNNTTGFVLDSTNTVHFIGAEISDSTSFGNVQHGIQAISGSGGADIVVHNTMMAGNANGLRAENAGGRILYSGSVISNNGVGLSTVSGGQLISNGTNRNRGNFTQGSPTSMHPLD